MTTKKLVPKTTMIVDWLVSLADQVHRKTTSKQNGTNVSLAVCGLANLPISFLQGGHPQIVCVAKKTEQVRSIPLAHKPVFETALLVWLAIVE